MICNCTADWHITSHRLNCRKVVEKTGEDLLYFPCLCYKDIKVFHVFKERTL